MKFVLFVWILGFVFVVVIVVFGVYVDMFVVVLLKIDIEGNLFGNFILQVLKVYGIFVIEKIVFGMMLIVCKVFMSGEIDVYFEYMGNVVFFFNKVDDLVWKNVSQGYDIVKKFDYVVNYFVWFVLVFVNNMWGVVLFVFVVQLQYLKIFFDFGKWVVGGGKVKFVVLVEFVNSVLVLLLFEKVYGFKLKFEQFVVLFGGDMVVMIKVVVNQIDGVNVVMVYGIDGGIVLSGFVVFDDDKYVQFVYVLVLVICEVVLKVYLQIVDLFKFVFVSFDLKML